MSKLRPDTKILDLVKWPPLVELNHSELLVYFNLVAASAKHGKRMQIRNADLHSDVRTARRALEGLEKQGFVKIAFAHGDASQRTIELVG